MSVRKEDVARWLEFKGEDPEDEVLMTHKGNYAALCRSWLAQRELLEEIARFTDGSGTLQPAAEYYRDRARALCAK